METTGTAPRICPGCESPTLNPALIFCVECHNILPDSPPLDARYRLERRLGTGGFGHTFMAHDLRTTKPVAVKRVLRATRSPQEAAASRRVFERERSLLAELNTPGHSNIPEVLDTFADEVAEYLVMKYITGQTLREKVNRNGPLGWGEVSAHLEQILSALAYMHARAEPVVHGDVKPENIIEDETGRLFLVDFGLARRQSLLGGWTTESGTISGTPGFASWDHWRIGPSALSDVYATGMVAYVLLTGEAGYSRLQRDAQEVMERLTPHPGLSPDDLKPLELPDEMKDLLLAVTATEPVERPTAADWLARLTEARLVDTKKVHRKVARPLVFPGGEAARTEEAFVALADKYPDAATHLIYNEDTLARWVETQCFRADLAGTIREVARRYDDRRQVLELCSQALDPRRPAPRLNLDPHPLRLKQSFFSRAATGQFTLTNEGPGYARASLDTDPKGISIRPTVVTLEPGSRQVIQVHAPPKLARPAHTIAVLRAEMAQPKEPRRESWPIVVARRPWWHYTREMVIVLLLAAAWYLAWDLVGRSGLTLRPETVLAPLLAGRPTPSPPTSALPEQTSAPTARPSLFEIGRPYAVSEDVDCAMQSDLPSAPNAQLAGYLRGAGEFADGFELGQPSPARAMPVEAGGFYWYYIHNLTTKRWGWVTEACLLKATGR